MAIKHRKKLFNDMINRRLLRVKVLQLLYAYYKNQNNTLVASEKELFFSIQKSYDLYHYLLLLPVELVAVAEKKIGIAKSKIVPTHQDLNPNTKFIGNKLIKQLAENVQIHAYASSHSISWLALQDDVKILYESFIQSDEYVEYMNSQEHSYREDQEFVLGFFLKFLVYNEVFYAHMEEKSIYWNDELDFVISMVAKTIKSFHEQGDKYVSIMPLFKDKQDEEFAKLLFRKAILNREKYMKMIEEKTKNWDLDRIAFMDILIMQLALTEIHEMQDIPVKVSFNEYLEIAKYYSTSKSNHFINGILDKLVKNTA